MITIHDVAKKSGVSPVTVSRAINHPGVVRPDTLQRVNQAIQELGFVPNSLAQGLRSRKTMVLALIMPDITNPFWTTVARGVEDWAMMKGYATLFCNTDENPEKQRNYIHVIIRQRVDGVIIAPFDSTAEHLAEIQDRNIPVVIIDRVIDGWNVDSVRCDSISGAHALVEHLVSLGHRQIGIISGPVGTTTADDRVTGYLQGLVKANLPVENALIYRGEYRAESGEALATQLVAEHPIITAIIAGNNAISIGVFAGLKKLNKKVPDDVALVTFDDLPDVVKIDSYMTAIAQPAYELGQSAASLLIKRIQQPSTPVQQIILPTELIIRSSSSRSVNDKGVTLQFKPEERITIQPTNLE